MHFCRGVSYTWDFSSETQGVVCKSGIVVKIRGKEGVRHKNICVCGVRVLVVSFIHGDNGSNSGKVDCGFIGRGWVRWDGVR